jgi:L-alanine-DL-glutamate epimerase-like enolase superfamily enzyme
VSPGTESQPTIERVDAEVYTVPTEQEEADGTLSWSSTTLVLARVSGGGNEGLGYTYGSAAAASLIGAELAEAVRGRCIFDVPTSWQAMQRCVRNIGRSGVAANAISALDMALWDLKARLLQQPLAMVLGRCRDSVPVYGSGGFTNYSDSKLREQLHAWVDRDGCQWVKMKVGSDASRDPHRVRTAREVVGEAGLFVDANGAYGTKQALSLAASFADCNVSWFEEPVSSDDLRGLHFVREHAPARMEIAAGEYGYTLDYFRCMLESGAVDVQQIDVTRCGGITAFLRAAALCEASHIDCSTHCAPAAHLHVACAAPGLRHMEWFHDHVLIEQRFFDGAPEVRAGRIQPDLSRPGIGLSFKHSDAKAYRI